MDDSISDEEQQLDDLLQEYLDNSSQRSVDVGELEQRMNAVKPKKRFRILRSVKSAKGRPVIHVAAGKGHADIIVAALKCIPQTERVRKNSFKSHITTALQYVLKRPGIYERKITNSNHCLKIDPLMPLVFMERG